MRTGIPFETITALLSSLPEGVTLDDKKQWVKLESNGNRIYIAKQKVCREVHLSSWGKDFPGTLPPPVHNGAVQAVLDMSAEDALETLTAFIQMLPSVPAYVKPVRAKKATKVVETSKPVEAAEGQDSYEPTSENDFEQPTV